MAGMCVEWRFAFECAGWCDIKRLSASTDTDPIDYSDLLICFESIRERHWQKYDRAPMRVAEVWEGFREACFARPEPETTGDFREDCLRASTNETFCAPTIRARVPQRPVVSSNGRHPALLPGDEPRVAFLWLLSLAKQRK